MHEASIDQIAAAVAPAYRALDCRGAAGILLTPLWGDDLTPFALELSEVNEEVWPDGYQQELGAPEITDPDLRAQADRLRDENALEAYWLALAAHLREVLGLPVLVHDVDVSIAEQYRRLTNAPPEDPLVGRDLLVRVDIDEHLVVAVTWREGMWMSGIARGTGPSEFVLIGAGLTELCRDPQVVAGALPRGAARARVQDRQDVWHEATVGRSAWLCVLPQRSRDGVNPPLEFLDTKGAPVELGEDAWGFGQPPDLRPHEAAVRAGALVPAIWFAADHGIPIFEGWDGPCDRATALYFVFGGWNVKISTQSTTAAEVFQQRLTRVPYEHRRCEKAHARHHARAAGGHARRGPHHAGGGGPQGALGPSRRVGGRDEN